MQLSPIPHFQSQILIFVQSCTESSDNPRHTLENPQHNSSPKPFKLTSRVPRCTIPGQHIPWFLQRQNWTHPHQIFTIWFSWSVSFSTCPASQADQFLFQPRSLKFTNSFLLLKINNVYLIPFQLSFWNSASMNLVQSSQILSISLFLKEFFHRHLNKLLSSLFSKNHLYPLMISTTFVQSLTSTSFPKFSKKLLPPAFNLTCLLTLCLLLFNLLTGSSINWNYSSQNSQWPHPCDGSWWGHFTHSSWLICCFRHCRSFHPSHSSSKLVWSWWSFSCLVHILSLISLSGSLNQWFHLCILFSFLWCTPRFRTWPTTFYSLYYSSLLGDLKKFPQISSVCWWHPAVHLFHSTNSALSLDTLTTTFNDILSRMNLNKLLLNPSKTEFLLIGTKQQRLKFSDLTNLSLSNDIIPVSSSARNLGFIFDSDMSFSDQIKSVSKSCHFHIRDIRRIRHLLPLSAATALANSLVSSKLDYCNSLYSGISQVNLNKLQRIQNSLARVITNTSKYQHITPILKKLHWLPIKQELITNSVFSHTKHLQINNQHIFTIVFHFLHILFLQDLLIHSFFPFHMFDHRLAKGLSLSSVHVSGIHSSWYPKLVFFTNIPFPAQNTPLQNCFPSLGSFPSPWTVYPDFDSCYSHFMPYRMTPSVRHRAIEVYYYYYYYYYY